MNSTCCRRSLPNIKLSRKVGISLRQELAGRVRRRDAGVERLVGAKVAAAGIVTPGFRSIPWRPHDLICRYSAQPGIIDPPSAVYWLRGRLPFDVLTTENSAHELLTIN